MKKPYKNEAGSYYTRSLFWDFWIALAAERRTIEPIFCLHDDRPGLVNCRKTFVELNDPTGYKWAMKYLGSYLHWEKLMAGTWFQEAVEKWNIELATKMRMEAIEKISDVANSDSQQALAAAKYIAERGWEKQTKGRPSSAELRGELKRVAQLAETEAEDIARIGLTVINGGKHG